MSKSIEALKLLHKEAYPNACVCWNAENEINSYNLIKKELERLTKIDAIDLDVYEEMLIDIENDNYKIESVLSYIRAILDTLKGKTDEH